MAMRKHELAGQHDELVLDMDRLHLLVVSPDDALPERRTRALLVRELRDFAAELEYHFGYEEEGGYLTAVTEQRPGLSRRVDDLQDQHTAILQRIDEVCSQADALPVQEIKAAISEVLDLLGEHERSEKTLLHEGVVTDLGTGD